MNNRTIIFIYLFLSIVILHANTDTLRISYTTISPKMEEEIFLIFEKQNNCKIVSNEFQTSEELINHEMILEDEVDLIFGLDQTNYYEIANDTLFVEFSEKYINRIYEDYLFKHQRKALPIAVDYLVFLFNSDKYQTKPSSFGQFQDNSYHKQIIMQNFHNSTIGKACYFWILSLFETGGYRHFWKSIEDNIYSYDDNIESATNKFIAGEASVLLTTHSRMQKLKNQYEFESVIPDEGGFGIVYQIAKTKFGEETILTEKFIEFILSRQIQLKLMNEYNLVSALDTRRKVNSLNSPSFNSDKSLNLGKDVTFYEKQRWINYLIKVLEKY